MHPETLLQVARIEHQQRVAEATRSRQVVRALTGRILTRRHDHEAASAAITAADGSRHAQGVPRWAA